MRALPNKVAPNEAYYWHVVGALERRGIVLAISAEKTAEAYGCGARALAGRYELAPGLPQPKVLKSHLEQQLAHIRQSKVALVAYGALWREIAIAEVESYIEWELASHRFDATWSGLLLDAMEEGLQTFSIAQMFYFCWTSVRDLASEHLRNPAPVEAYKTYLHAKFTGKLGRATRDEWPVKPYSRQWHRPASALAETFSTHATGLGERYLLSVPSHESLSSLF